MANESESFHIGIIGGGIAGSTTALRFADLGAKVTLFEAGSSLVNGPPVCHLHAGGNLYREISTAQCLTLLKECIAVVRIFPHTINYRPTVIAIPTYDSGNVSDILPRLKELQEFYKNMIAEDPRNKVLGNPETYYKIYSQEDILNLRRRQGLVSTPKSFDEWMIPIAKHLELDRIKSPLLMVQEFGWSVIRMAAAVTLALSRMPTCDVKLNTKVTQIRSSTNTNKWLIAYKHESNDNDTKNNDNNQKGERRSSHSNNNAKNSAITEVDYVVNACGYQTGTIDDLVGVKAQRMVEFKSAYVTQWDDEKHTSSNWPELIIHGTRGTPRGMAQLTPYPNGIFQLHGMTNDITLFPNGLAKTVSNGGSQPELGWKLQKKLLHGWADDEVGERTERAIVHVAQFVPSFARAYTTGVCKPMYGAQQIPGRDATLRAASVSFVGDRYARLEIVKGSSAIEASGRILHHCISSGLLHRDYERWLTVSNEEAFATSLTISEREIVQLSEKVARKRDLPIGIAQPVRKQLVSRL